MDNPQEIKREKVRVVPIKYIDDFPDHPFKVFDDESNSDFVEFVISLLLLHTACDRKFSNR